MRAGRARRGEGRPQVAGDRDQPTAGPNIFYAIARSALNASLDRSKGTTDPSYDRQRILQLVLDFDARGVCTRGHIRC